MAFVLDKLRSVKVAVQSPFQPFYVTNTTGELFYYKTGGKQAYTFNLPKGEYIFSQPVNVLNIGRPLVFKLKVPLPEPEHKFFTNDFFIDTVKNQQGYAKVSFPSGLITVNEKFHTLPYPVKYWIIEHEKGHRLYKTESNADLYALKKYLNEGFNPSTIIQAFECGMLKDTPQNNARTQIFFRNFDKLIEIEK